MLMQRRRRGVSSAINYNLKYVLTLVFAKQVAGGNWCTIKISCWQSDVFRVCGRQELVVDALNTGVSSLFNLEFFT